jgi:hypothetical protein
MEDGKVVAKLKDRTRAYSGTTGGSETSDRFYVQSLHTKGLGWPVSPKIVKTGYARNRRGTQAQDWAFEALHLHAKAMRDISMRTTTGLGAPSDQGYLKHGQQSSDVRAKLLRPAMMLRNSRSRYNPLTVFER